MASTHTHTSRDRHRKALMHAGPARDSLQYSKFQTFFLFGPESWVFLVSVYSSAVETLLSAFVHGFLDHSDKMLIQGKKYPRGVCTLVHGISSKVTVSLTRQQVDVRPRTSAIDIRLPIPDLFSDPPPLPQPTRTHHGLPLGHPNNYRLFIEHYLPQPAAKLQVPKAILKNLACISFPFSCLASANNRASTRYPHTYIQVVHARAHQRIALHVCAEHIHKYLCASTSAYIITCTNTWPTWPPHSQSWGTTRPVPPCPSSSVNTHACASTRTCGHTHVWHGIRSDDCVHTHARQESQSTAHMKERTLPPSMPALQQSDSCVAPTHTHTSPSFSALMNACTSSMRMSAYDLLRHVLCTPNFH